MARSIPENSGAIHGTLTKKTGPRTSRGKAASSKNARKHGLRSRDVVIPGESRTDFNNLLRDLWDDLNPVGAVEEELVAQIAVCMWRLRRAARTERSILALRYVQEYPPRKGPGPDSAKDEMSLGVVFYGAHVGEVGATEKIANLMRYETTNRRSLDRALDRLEKLQTARIASLEPVEVHSEVEGVDTGPSERPDITYAGSADRLMDLQSRASQI